MQCYACGCYGGVNWPIYHLPELTVPLAPCGISQSQEDDTDDLKSRIPQTEEGHTYRESTEIWKYMHSHTHKQERENKSSFPRWRGGSWVKVHWRAESSSNINE